MLATVRTLVALAAASLPAQVATAQLDATATWWSVERDASIGLALGDWDADGDLDVAVANLGDPDRVYRNGDGTLSLAWSSAVTGARPRRRLGRCRW